jgi:RNA polymerase sigma-B factor
MDAGATMLKAKTSLERDEVTALLEAYRESGDRRAVERVLRLHGRLLDSLVRRYAVSSDESYEDLLQVGYVGLMKAVNRYDSAAGAKFGTYAHAMIEGELRHHFRDAGLLKKPRWARGLYARVSETTTRLTAELGRPPLVDEIASEVNVSPQGIMEIMKLYFDTNVASLDGEEFDLTAIKSMHHESFSLPIEDRIQLERALESLSEIQRKVIYLFFYKDLCQTEIGRRLGLSQRKTSRTVASALKALRNSEVMQSSEDARGWGLE